MKKKAGRKKELDSYMASIEASQKNVIWPDVLRDGRSVDELLWKERARRSSSSADRRGGPCACIFDGGGDIYFYGCRAPQLVSRWDRDKYS